MSVFELTRTNGAPKVTNRRKRLGEVIKFY